MLLESLLLVFLTFVTAFEDFDVKCHAIVIQNRNQGQKEVSKIISRPPDLGLTLVDGSTFINRSLFESTFSMVRIREDKKYCEDFFIFEDNEAILLRVFVEVLNRLLYQSLGRVFIFGPFKRQLYEPLMRKAYFGKVIFISNQTVDFDLSKDLKPNRLCYGDFRNCHLEIVIPRYNLPYYDESGVGYGIGMTRHISEVRNIR